MNPHNKTGAYALIAVGVVLAGLAITGTADIQDAEAAQSFHCEMFALWQAEAAQGIAPAQRQGWPNYNNSPCN